MKIGCIIDLNEDDRINQKFYEMALKRIKVLTSFNVLERLGFGANCRDGPSK